MTEIKDISKIDNITTQMEYYLSDENLKNDSFFHQQISTNPNGYVDINLFLNCHKISKAKWTKEDLIKGIMKSNMIELDENYEKVRRKNNTSLPELKLLNKKRMQEEEKENEEEEDENDEQPTNDPIVLKVSSEKDINIQRHAIQKEFADKNLNLNVVYVRFKVNEGHIVVFVTPNEELKFTESLELEGNIINIQKACGDDLIDFWKDHGNHYIACTRKDKRKELKKNVTSYLIKLGNESYHDFHQIRKKVKDILDKTKDNESLNQYDEDFIHEILKYHHNYKDKIKEMNHFTVGKPENYDSSRCFMIVKNNDEKVDFSIQKCIKTIEMNHKKKHI